MAFLSTKQEISETIHDLLAGRIGREILSGDLAPGEKLGEVALAERFETSRTAVRAALSQLSEIGLVSLVRNSGARVRSLSRADARALYEVRAALEAEAAFLAAAHAQAATRRDLESLLDQHSGEVALHPTGAYLQGSKDQDFHMVVAQMSENPIIIRYLSRELYPQLSLLRIAHRNIGGRGAIALGEHRRIAEAIWEGDSDVASLLMRRHVRNSWAALEPQLGADNEEET